MDKERARFFQKIRSQIGNTPLYEIKDINIPNGNRIFAKEEFRNQITMSHYDRVYVELFYNLEERGKIDPSRVHVVETTSGNAGTAFAAIAEKLGYKATVIIPEGVSKARLNSIAERGAEIIQTPKNLFIKGAVDKLKHLIKVENKERIRAGKLPYYCPDHSRNKITIDAMSKIGKEVISHAPNKLNYFVAAAGNGSSILGPAKYLMNNGLKIIAWDPIQAPTAFQMKYPGRYKSLFGIHPGTLGPHYIYGTGVLGVDFPFLKEAILGTKDIPPIVDDVILIKNEEAILTLSSLKDASLVSKSGFERALALPDFAYAYRLLADTLEKPVGFSSGGSLAVALKLCEAVKNKNILVIFYDHAKYYMM